MSTKRNMLLVSIVMCSAGLGLAQTVWEQYPVSGCVVPVANIY